MYDNIQIKFFLFFFFFRTIYLAAFGRETEVAKGTEVWGRHANEW